MACTMLCENNLSRYFWTKNINTACYILNRVLVRPVPKKTPYELWKDRKPNIGYFYEFGCRFYIHNNEKDNLSKFDVKSNEGIFLGYATTSRAYRVFNKKTLLVEETIHVIFDEIIENLKERDLEEEKNLLENKLDELNLNDTNT